MVNDRNLLFNYESYESSEKEIKIQTSDKNTSMLAIGFGNLRFKSEDGFEAIFYKVLLVPQLKTNLISISTIANKGYSVEFDSEKCYIYNTAKEIRMSGVKDGNNYVVKGSVDILCDTAHVASTTIISSPVTPQIVTKTFVEWHSSLGHIDGNQIRKLESKGLIKVKGANNNELIKCDSCNHGKAHKLPFRSSGLPKASALLERVMFDTSGPYISSKGGAKYIISFVDEFSEEISVKMMKHKSEAQHLIKDYVVFKENQTDKKVKILRSDNAAEFRSNIIMDFTRVKGIKHELTIPYCSNQNGKAERIFRTIFDAVRTILVQSSLPKWYWGEAVNYFVYVRNRTHIPPNKEQTSYELMTGKKPSLNMLHPFGCLCYVLITPAMAKTDPRAEKGILVGYSENIKGYRVLMLSNMTICSRRHVIFDNTIFYGDLVKNSRLKKYEYSKLKLLDEEEENDTNLEEYIVANSQNNFEENNLETDSENDDDNNEDVDLSTTLDNNKVFINNVQRIVDVTVDRSYDEEESIINSDSDNDTNGENNNNSSGYDIDGDYLHNNSLENSSDSDSNDDATMENIGTNNLRRSGRITAARDFGPFVAHAATIDDVEAPLTLKEAIKIKEWRGSIMKELKSHISNGTWQVVTKVPPGRKAIGYKFIFKNKYNEQMEVIKLKTRIVFKGYDQVHGIDYFETFAPVVKISTVLFVLALVAHHGLHTLQMDVNTAFVQSELDESEELYMKMPPIYEWLINNPNADDFPPEALLVKESVVRLIKSLYGTKQAPRIWNKKIDGFLRSFGLQPLKSDPCCYFKVAAGGILIVCLYVDDLLLCGSNWDDIMLLKMELCNNFDMTDLGPVTHLLGMHITRDMDKKKLYINQSAYIKSALDTFSLKDSNAVVTPMENKFSSIKFAEHMAPTNGPYNQLIGTLLYLSTHTRPDIAYSVGYLSRFLKNYKEIHWNAAKRVLKYLKGTMDHGIMFDGNCPLEIECYVDADWGSDVNSERKSTTGFVFTACGGPISWKSRKQSVVALSSCESEYVALAEAIKELTWLINMIGEIKVIELGSKPEVVVNIDNMAAKYLAENEVVHARSKHIDIKYHFVKEKLLDGLFKLVHVASENNSADGFTKPLGGPAFKKFRDAVGVVEVEKLVIERLDDGSIPTTSPGGCFGSVSG